MRAVRMTDGLRYGINDYVQQARCKVTQTVRRMAFGLGSGCSYRLPTLEGRDLNWKLVAYLILPRRRTIEFMLG